MADIFVFLGLAFNNKKTSNQDIFHRLAIDRTAVETLGKIHTHTSGDVSPYLQRSESFRHCLSLWPSMEIKVGLWRIEIELIQFMFETTSENTMCSQENKLIDHTGRTN